MRWLEVPKAGDFCAPREHCCEVGGAKAGPKLCLGQDPQGTQNLSDHNGRWAFFLRAKDGSTWKQLPAALH